MVWSTPLTASDGSELTAAQWNASVRDNLNETAVAKATASGRYIVTAGATSLVERIPSSSSITTSETTTSTSYANLATTGPEVLALTTGPKALVITACTTSNNTVNAETFAATAIGGATTQAASDTQAIKHTSATANASVGCSWAWIYSLTGGANDFRLQYQVSSGTGTWANRRISVMPF